MKLLFKQRMFSWFDSYDIYDENENVVFRVKGQFALGHCLNIYDTTGNEVGSVRQKLLTFMPKFEMYEYNQYIGCVSREFTFLKPKYNIDFKGWDVEGSFMEWDYSITSSSGGTVATISKELFHMTDTYVLNIIDPKDALYVLMFVLAIDAEKCSRE